MTRRISSKKEKKPISSAGKRKRGCTKKKFRKIWKRLKAKTGPKSGEYQDHVSETPKIYKHSGKRTNEVRQKGQWHDQNFLNITAVPRKTLRCFGRVKCCSENRNEYKFEFVARVQSDLTLQFIFFDGEEAFHRWTKTDSLYGARNLAAKMQRTLYPEENNDGTNHLHRIDLFVLLDLLGTSDVQFFNYFKNTERWFARFISYEQRLNDLQLLHQRPFMFKKRSKYNPGIEDDHIPFLERGVPVLHLIPVPFPSVWHKNTDNASALHYPSIENFNKVLRAFVSDYLHLVF